MTVSLVTLSIPNLQPEANLSAGDSIFVRGWYSRDFVAGDGVTPVQGGDGQQGFYYNIECSLVNDKISIPDFEVQATTLSNPAASFFLQLYINGAPSQWIIPNTQASSGWQIPTIYGTTIAFDELATYNRAKQLVYAPDTYFTADETIREIRRLAGDQQYAGVGVLGIIETFDEPVAANHPIAINPNSYATTARVGIGRSSVTRSPTSDVTFVETTDARVNPNYPLLITRVYSGNGALIVGKIVKIDSSGNAVLTTAGDTSGCIGVVVSGSTNAVVVGIGGLLVCETGGGVIPIGRYVQISASVNGLITSVVGYPTTGQVLGRVVGTAGLTTALVDFFGSEIQAGAFAITHSSHTNDYTLATTDQNKIISLFTENPSATLTLPNPATTPFPNRWVAFAQNIGLVGGVNGYYILTPASSTIDGKALAVLYPGYGVMIQSDGTNWWTVGESDSGLPDDLPAIASRRSLGAFPNQAVAGDDARLQAVTNATSAATPNTLALRDQNADISFNVVNASVVNASSLGYEVNSTKVVGARGASVDDATNAGDVITQLNLLLARIRAHGLIADPTPPNAPSALTAVTVSSSRIDLSWTDNSAGAASFKIERCSGVGCSNFSQIATTIAGVTTLQNTGLSQGTSYTYRVRAHTSGGDSGFSNSATAVTQSGPVAPDAVAGLAQWLKADAILGLSNGDPVATWPHSGSVGTDATQATSARRPTYLTNVVNSKSVVRFDNTNSQWMGFTAISNIRSVFMVVKDLNTNGTAAPGQFPVLLGDLATFDFAGGANDLIFDSGNTSSNIQGAAVYVNGQQEAQNGSALNLTRPTSFRLIEIITTGNVNASNLFNDRNAYFGHNDLAEIAIYTTAVSAGDRQGLEQYFVNRYGSQISATAILRSNVVFVGDSQTNPSYTVRVRTCLTPIGCSSVINASSYDWYESVLAAAGYTLQDMAVFDSQAAAMETASRVHQVITIHGGTNDLYGNGSGGNVATPVTAYSRLIDRINAYKAAGYTKLVVVNCLPRSNPGTPVTFETSRQTFNGLIDSGAAGNGYVVADAAANMLIGQAGDETNTTYYYDLVHLTDAGNDILAPIVSAAIISIL